MFLQMSLHKTFANHFRGDYMQNKTLKHFCKCLILHLTRVELNRILNYILVLS